MISACTFLSAITLAACGETRESDVGAPSLISEDVGTTATNPGSTTPDPVPGTTTPVSETTTPESQFETTTTEGSSTHSTRTQGGARFGSLPLVLPINVDGVFELRLVGGTQFFVTNVHSSEIRDVTVEIAFDFSDVEGGEGTVVGSTCDEAELSNELARCHLGTIGTGEQVSASIELSFSCVECSGGYSTSVSVEATT